MVIMLAEVVVDNQNLQRAVDWAAVLVLVLGQYLIVAVVVEEELMFRLMEDLASL